MNRASKLTYTWRFYFLNALLLICVIGLIWRMVDLTIFDREFLKGQGDARTIRTIKIPAYRGMITDRNGEPLAISTPVNSIWVNPQDFSPTDENYQKLATILHTSIANINARVNKSKHKEFTYLKRGLDPATTSKIKALNITGLYQLREFRRFYPEAEVTSHLLGFTNIDDQGQEGIELVYNQWLQGVAGAKKVLKDRLGHIVADVDDIREPKPGHNLALSIDRRIQYLAYRELKTAVEEHQAKSGSVVVLDAKTGEVLAMVNQPAFNPNKRHRDHDSRYRNRAVTDLFEPGSVIKAFSVASALDSGKFQPNTMIDTSPGWMVVGRNTIKDPHRDNGVIDVTEILKRSSNIGVTKMTLALPAEQLVGLLRRVGFGERTDSNFPGESAGVLDNHATWRPFVLATLAFGYGISVTPLQLTHAYTVFANNGNLRPVSLLRVDEVPDGKQVLSPQVANNMLQMLHQVVDGGGTGKRARVPGYTVAGKTGTSRIAGPNGYTSEHHVGTFVGIAPAKNPKLVIAVIINDPQAGNYYGGIVAAPVFSHVMAGSLRILNIPPDNITKM